MTCTIQIWMPTALPVAVGALEALPGVVSDSSSTDASRFVTDVRSLSLPADQNRSPFFLPPASSRYLCGLLGETASGRMVLGVSKYLEGGHEAIDFAMRNVFGASRILLWGGEIFLKNKAPTAGMGSAVAWNETTGYLERLSRVPSVDGVVVRNSVENVQSALQNLKALNVAPDARFISFDPMNQHLDPLLQSVSGQSSFANIRHGVLNVTCRLGFVFSALEYGDSLQDVVKQLAQMSTNLNNIGTVAAILMRDNPALSEKLTTLLEWIQRVTNESPLTKEELLGVMDSLVFFDELFSLPIEKRTMTFDLFPA